MKKLLLIAAVVILFAGFQVKRERWEYKTAVVSGEHTVRDMNALGADGWELVNAEFNGIASVCFFKRRY